MTMNKYTQWLGLDFDPFAPGSTSRDFYCSGHRQQILDQIVELSLYSNAMIAVTGPLGAGKTTLATNFCDRFAEEAVCVKITATLFMNQNQFLEPLHDALGFQRAINSDVESSIEQICRYAAELDLEARSLILIIDDAHELSAEVLQLLTQLLEGSVDSSIHALLFGGNQLDSLLQSTLTLDAQERLAVFPLSGFASDETHEYIRFKLATARFTKELPIDGGIIGAIHNSSEGMPGAINSLAVDALNSAMPASESDELAGTAPMFSGERMGQVDEYRSVEAIESYDRDEDEYEDEDEAPSPVPVPAPEQAWIASIQPRYWAVAASLFVLLTGTLLFWDTVPDATESMPITVAVTPTATATQAIEVEPETELAVVATAEAPAVAIAEAEPIAPIEVEAITAKAVAVMSSEPEIAALAEAVEPIVEIAVAAIPVVKEAAVITAASPFVERLLQASPGNYAVQLLASHSEVNISKFVGELGSDQSAGYFETRFQGKPWFVAVLAAFDDRGQATRAIASLPAKLRSNEPWIRSVAGIQTDIRELLNSKLVSSK